jgi:hypothetical protein
VNEHRERESDWLAFPDVDKFPDSAVAMSVSRSAEIEVIVKRRRKRTSCIKLGNFVKFGGCGTSCDGKNVNNIKVSTQSKCSAFMVEAAAELRLPVFVFVSETVKSDIEAGAGLLFILFRVLAF